MGLQDPVNRDGKQNQHRNEAVGGKKRRVDFAEVVCADEGVFVKQRGAGDDHPGRGDRSQTEAEEHPDKAGEGDQMEQAREAQRAGDAERAWDRMQSAGHVVLPVLAAIKDVEASSPEHDGGGHDQDARIERSAHRDPRGGGRDAHGQAEKQMGPAGETLGVGVGADDQQGQGRQPEGERIQVPCGKEKQSARGQRKAKDEAAGQQSRGKGAGRGARIQRIDFCVHQAVERHGRRTRGNHRDADPAQGAQRGNSVGRQDRASEPEREREKRVLPLDHIERDADIVKDILGHRLNSRIADEMYCIRWPERHATSEMCPKRDV